MKEEATPHLMKGEVEPPVGPPQAHSLGDEKAFPAAEQVPVWARTQGHTGQFAILESTTDRPKVRLSGASRL
ncbi:hypothetical protein PAMP_019753 [Pampus punctatissimus]